jgi:hypothetical protein
MMFSEFRNIGILLLKISDILTYYEKYSSLPHFSITNQCQRQRDVASTLLLWNSTIYKLLQNMPNTNNSHLLFEKQ